MKLRPNNQTAFAVEKPEVWGRLMSKIDTLRCGCLLGCRADEWAITDKLCASAPPSVAPVIKAAERRLLRVMISYVVGCTGRRGDRSAERVGAEHSCCGVCSPACSGLVSAGAFSALPSLLQLLRCWLVALLH